MDQLVAPLRPQCARPLPGADWRQILLPHQRVTAQRLQRHLEARAQAQARGRSPADDTPATWESSATALELRAYAQLGRSSGQEVTHERAGTDGRPVPFAALASHRRPAG